jgi:DNA mismatch repair protein MSH4
MYVPAEAASVRVADRVLTRLGTGDSMETNSSTFMLEMRDTAHILQARRSLAGVAQD